MNKNRRLGLAFSLLLIGGSWASLGAMGGGRGRQPQPGYHPNYRSGQGIKGRLDNWTQRFQHAKNDVPILGEAIAAEKLAKEVTDAQASLLTAGNAVKGAFATVGTVMLALAGKNPAQAKAGASSALSWAITFNEKYSQKPALFGGLAALALTGIFKEELCRGVSSLFGYNSYGYNNRNHAYGGANGVSYYQLNPQQQHEVNMHITQQAQFNRGRRGAVALNHDQMANQLFVKGWFGGVNRR